MRILICEDSEQNLQSAREFAEKVKGEHEVVIFEKAVPAASKVRSSECVISSRYFNGEVLDVVYGEKVDCVLTDLYLPTRKGTSLPCGLYVALAALQLGIPACIITDGNAHGDDELVSHLSIALQTKNERFQFFLLESESSKGAKIDTVDTRMMVDKPLIKDWEFCFRSLMQSAIPA